MSKEFWMVTSVGGGQQYGPYDTHGAAVIKAQTCANKKPGVTYAVGHFKEAWSMPKVPAVQLDLSQEQNEDIPGVDAAGGNDFFDVVPQAPRLRVGEGPDWVIRLNEPEEGDGA